jgi:uncharacterized membrane protein
MAPLICLLLVTALAEILHRIVHMGDVHDFADSVRLGLAAMFILTGIAHFNRMKDDLVRMIPDWIPNPRLVVFATGVMELTGAGLLLVRSLAPCVALGFIAFLLAIFPANIKAARTGATLGGRKVMGIVPRGLIQLVFIAACGVVAAPR